MFSQRGEGMCSKILKSFFRGCFSIGRAGDFVGEGVDAGDDFVGFLGADADGGEGFEEVFDEGAEVGGGDAAAVVDGAEGAAGVGDGTAEGHGEELLLHALEGIHGGVFEEGGEVGVGEDAGVEGGDEGFDDGGTADAIVEGGHGEEEGVWSSVFLRSRMDAEAWGGGGGG